MKTNFYIIRHGQTDNNAKQLWQGKDNNSKLNMYGIDQIKKLAEKLDTLHIERLYTSPLLRAKETAELISSHCDIPIFVRQDLREVDYGVAEGQPISDIFEKYPEIAQLWYHPQPEKFDNHFEGGESQTDVLNRLFPILDKIINYQNQLNMSDWRIGIVTHAGVICSLLAKLGVENPTIDNGEVIHIIHDDTGYHFCKKLF